MILQKVVSRVATSIRHVAQHTAKSHTTIAENVTAVRNSNCGPDGGIAPLRLVPKRPAPPPPRGMKSEVARVVNKAYKRAELKPSLNRSAETFTKGREMQERIANRSQSNAPPPSEKRVKRPAPQPPTEGPTVERFNRLWGKQLSMLTDEQSKELAKKLHDALQPFRERAANTRDATPTPRQ